MLIPRVRPVPITGYVNLNALGSTRAQILEGLATGTTGLASPSEPWGVDTAVGEVRAELPTLDGELAPWSTRIGGMAALLVAGLDEELRRARARWRSERIGLFLGTSTGGATATERAFQHYVAEGHLPPDYDFVRQHTFGALLHVVATLTGARGPGWVISTACTSGSKPFATAQRLIAADMIDAAIVGGIDTLCALTLHGFHALQALDRQPCRPFHADRAGISIGEGGALALLERDGEARVVLEGVGETSDAYHISAPHPEGLGARTAMEAAIAQAGCSPGDIHHVNAHGTGTQLNDVAEAKAISEVLGNDVPVVSTKGYTGHTLGAAGAIEFAFAATVIEEGWIPPSLGAAPVDPAVAINICTERTSGTFRRVLSNSFAFGGNNVSLLVRGP